MKKNILSLNILDGNAQKRLLQAVSLMLFIMIVLYSLEKVPTRKILISSSQNEFIKSSNPTESIKIVAHKNYEMTKQSNKKYAFTVVTAASENHFCPIKSFIYNMKNTLKDLNARLIIYDLGLNETQRNKIKSLMNDGYFDELRYFDFSIYPSFFNITESRGEYAWKPTIVKEVSKDFPGIIAWLDSGTLPERIYFKKLSTLLNQYDGFLSPRSSGVMRTWTHPGVYEYFKDDASKYDKIPNCNGASVAFDTKKTQHIIDDWYLCALDKNCIAPPGSSRLNHRQDQSILSYLISREGRRCNVNAAKFWIHPHQDINCEVITNYYEKLYNIE